MTEPADFLADPQDVPALREAVSTIVRTGYSEVGVRERLGLADLTDLQWRALPIYRAEHLSKRDPLDLAIDLFFLQGTLPTAELDRLFAAPARDALIRTGLLAIDESGIARARASLFPAGPYPIVSDHAWPEMSHPGLTSVPSDLVMAVGHDSRHLAHCTRRHGVESALDLCTGSGIQAVLSTAHSRRVLAVDINPRAVSCARFNARALGISNLEVTLGDLFEPARDERFDLITANPPFVPSPVDTLRFRDGGRSGEDIQKRIVAGLPRHLAPGGIAQMITELGERDGEPIAPRVRAWLEGAPLDIHILRLREHTAQTYAIGHAKGDQYDTFLDSVSDWSGNLRVQGYARVVSVLVTFQWSDPACGASWDRVDESRPPVRAAGAEIEQVFLIERLIRNPDFRRILKNSRLQRAGPIALQDARVLGGDLRANAKATLLGQALTVEAMLEPIEREILIRMDEPIAVPQLLQDFDEDSAIASITSLLRRRLIRVLQ